VILDAKTTWVPSAASLSCLQALMADGRNSSDVILRAWTSMRMTLTPNCCATDTSCRPGVTFLCVRHSDPLLNKPNAVMMTLRAASSSWSSLMPSTVATLYRLADGRGSDRTDHPRC